MKKNNRWEPLGHYRYADTDYIVFAKRKKNGLVAFKTRRVHSLFCSKSEFFPHESIDPKKQWEKILNDGV